MQHTKLSRLFTQYTPTLSHQSVSTRELKTHYTSSIAYLNELGFLSKIGLTVQNNRLYIDNKPPIYRFTKTERKILHYLLEHSDEVVSYYQLADVVWEDDPDSFSLWALSRMIYKIRNKLWKNGLSAEHIRNIRGEGYCYMSSPG